MNSDKTNTTVNTLGDRLRFYEETLGKQAEAIDSEEQAADQGRFETLRELKGFIDVQIFMDERFKREGTQSLSEISSYIEAELLKLEKKARLDSQILIEAAVEHLTMADMNNIRFHPDQVRSGEIGYARDRVRKEAWPYGRVNHGPSNSGPIPESGSLDILSNDPPVEVEEKVIIEPQKRTDEVGPTWPKFDGE